MGLTPSRNVTITDLTIPVGKYFLADAGFPICEGLLIPYRGVCHHLQVWGGANLQYICILFLLAIPCIITLIISPSDAEELFNLRYANDFLEFSKLVLPSLEAALTIILTL
jgi:hypothetical protein